MILYQVTFPFTPEGAKDGENTLVYPSISAAKASIQKLTGDNNDSSSPICAGEILIHKLTTHKLTKDVVCRMYNTSVSAGCQGFKLFRRYRFIPGKRLRSLPLDE